MNKRKGACVRERNYIKLMTNAVAAAGRPQQHAG